MKWLVLSYQEFNALCLTSITTLLSMSIALFTLTIAFLVNKKESVNYILKQIQDGGISLTLSSKLNSAKKYIAKMSTVTSLSAWGIILSLLGVIVYLIFLFLPNTDWNLLMLLPIGGSGICNATAIIKLLLWYFKS